MGVLCVYVCVSVCIPFDGTGEIVCILSISLLDSLSVCLSIYWLLGWLVACFVGWFVGWLVFLLGLLLACSVCCLLARFVACLVAWRQQQQGHSDVSTNQIVSPFVFSSSARKIPSHPRPCLDILLQASGHACTHAPSQLIRSEHRSRSLLLFLVCVFLYRHRHHRHTSPLLRTALNIRFFITPPPPGLENTYVQSISPERRPLYDSP